MHARPRPTLLAGRSFAGNSPTEHPNEIATPTGSCYVPTDSQLSSERASVSEISQVSRDTNSIDTLLRERAQRVLPGGLWGHMDVRRLPEGYPQYFLRADGCRLRDVDGREFIDFMCSWGPIVLGHHHPAVEAAVREQTALGDCMNGPAPVLVELAEAVVDLVPHADWCIFGKNGTDATTPA
jgi:glutamate-1-semialdehyde 2,1-aminomutase